MRTLIFSFVVFFFATTAFAQADNFLTTMLSTGDEGPEVTLLQTWLSKDSTVYPEQVVNGIFGPATERAVKRFQQEMGIISVGPSGDSMYGKAGPVTRAELNAQFSNIKGGVASVEGEYNSMMKFDGTNFVPLTEKVYGLNTPTSATFSVWLNPITPAERMTPVLESGGYGIGLAEHNRLYATSPKGEAFTTESPVREGEWQHISVLFTGADAVFIYDNTVLEIVPLAQVHRTSVFGNIFERIADTLSVLFPSVSYLPKEAPVSESTVVETRHTGIVGSVVSFARGLFGLPPVSPPVPVTVTEAEAPTGTQVTPEPIPAAIVTASPHTGAAPTITIPAIFIPTNTPAGSNTSTSSLTTGTTTATTTAVVATTTKNTSKSRGKTPKDSTPLITLIGSKKVSVAPGAVYTDPGATAFDLEDGDLTSQITIGGDTIDYDIPATYHITYNVSDSSGEKAKEVIRDVTIMTIPELSPEEQEPHYDLATAGQSVAYSVSSEAGADPKFISIDINPLHVYVGDTQTFTVKVSSESGVESVTTSTKLDTVTHELALEKVDDTTFTGSWVVYDTHVRTYRTEFTARSGSGNENSMTMAWSDPCSGVTQGVASSLSANCTVSSVYGLDGANMSLNGFTLTINSGGTWAWNPGTTITVDGTISKGAGGTIQKGYLYYLDAGAGNIDDTTFYFFTTSSQTGYLRAATYSQGSYYSEPSYCFAGETLVLMADGSYKEIKDVAFGDVVMGQDAGGNNKPQIVTKLYHHRYEMNGMEYFGMLKLNNHLIVRPEHPMMTPGGTVDAKDLRVGDTLIGEEGLVIVESIEKGPDLRRVYNLSVYPDHTYFAGGVLVHNKGMHGLPP